MTEKQLRSKAVATISACAIACGLTDIMPTECSVEQMRREYEAMGRWVSVAGGMTRFTSP